MDAILNVLEIVVAVLLVAGAFLAYPSAWLFVMWARSKRPEGRRWPAVLGLLGLAALVIGAAAFAAAYLGNEDEDMGGLAVLLVTVGVCVPAFLLALASLGTSLRLRRAQRGSHHSNRATG